MESKLADLITDNDFERIEMSLQESNIFNALSIERMELKHSNFIGYLLNPNASHGLNDLFIKKFLRDIFSNSKAEDRKIFDVDSLNFNSIQVRREWRNIDILIIFESDVIVIENKIDTMDHSNQLRRYKHIIEESFQKHKKHFVFLTPFGVDPDDEESKLNYINYSYLQISNIISSIIEIYKDNISQKMQYYLIDYKKTIDRELLMNDSLNEIAVKLYYSHKDALDFIFENRPDPASVIYPYFERELIRRGYKIGSKNKGYIRFTSAKLSNNIPKTNQSWSEKESFLFEIEYYWSGKFAVINAVLAPCNEGLKNKIIEEVKKSKKYKEPSGKKWLVFYKKKIPFIAEDVVNEDDIEIENKISSIINEIEPDIKEFITLLENVF